MDEAIDIERHDNEDYLSKELTILINELTKNSKPKWGYMTPQHMMEHLEGSFKISNGEIKLTELKVKESEIGLKQAFLFSGTPFAQNIAIGEKGELKKLKYASFEEAKANFFKQLIAFFAHHDKEKTITYLHPSFGDLDYKAWLQFHKKHVKYHFAQFGIVGE